MKTNIIIIFAFLLVAFTNCKKEDNGSVNILCSKTWERGVVDLNSLTNPSGEILYEPVPDCVKDDSFRFNSDGIILINRNSNKCDQNELQNESLSYSIDRTEKELIIDGITYTLLEESHNQIKYSAFVPNGTSFGRNLIFLLQ